jgi:hypothetical protein
MPNWYIPCSIIPKEMNILWSILIGLTASVVGGVLSGLFVMRKMTHDNKRLCVNEEFAVDFYVRYVATMRSIVRYLGSLGYETSEIKSATMETLSVERKSAQKAFAGLYK